MQVILFIFMVMSLSFQSAPALQGPLVAVTPASQDQIVIYDVGTNSQRFLDFEGGFINAWGFSPDGCEILLTQVEANGLAKLYAVDLNGENIRPLVTYDELPPMQWGIWEPQWSPDGSKIAFTMLRDGFEGESERQYHVGWVPAEGGQPVFYSVTGREHSPEWSPDGNWLAYISYEERVAGPDIYSTAEPTREPPQGESPAPTTMINEADLWIVSADSETKYRHTAFPVGNVSQPTWSPDGDLLSFVYSPSPNNDTFWIIGSQQGAIPTQLSYNWSLILDMTWLPDSSAIIAAVRDFREVSENKLWQLPLVGNADNEAFIYIENTEITNADYPRFSSDGRYIALRSAYSLVVFDTREKSILYLSEELNGNTPPIWSPEEFDGEIQCSL